MRPASLHFAALGCALLVATGGVRAEPVRIDGAGVRAVADQIGVSVLQVDLWPNADGGLGEIAVQVDGIDLPRPTVAPFPAEGQTGAVLVMVDTSDPKRKRVVGRNIEHIKRLIEGGPAHVRFGLARFDTDFEILAPLGSDAATLVAAVDGIGARGATTELFRHTLSGISAVAAERADRKAIVLLSDGRSEDTAYESDDVVAAARAAGVVIYSLGYATTVTGTLELQSLVRMSSETGGLYFPADKALNLPDDFVERIVNAFDTGGRALIDLLPAVTQQLEGERDVILTIAGAGAPVTLKATVVLPDVSFMARNRPYFLAILALILLVAAAIAIRTYLRARRLREERRLETERAIPFAFLEFLDDSEMRFPVGSAPVRVGRGEDNDIQLNNTSVSAHHAEIQRRRDGSFMVTDLGSLNGVSVNDKMQHVGKLADGDVIELGEIRVRFALNPERA